MAKYQEANRESMRDYAAAHYAANKERKQALNREWKKNNPEKMADYNHRRRARKYAVAYEIIDVAKVAERDGWTCGVCCLPINPDLRFPDPGSRSIDHIVALARGGSHTYDNVQLAHFLCNNLKFVG
jgi:5-methylcytosine-specific restriction endonuclease McrA